MTSGGVMNIRTMDRMTMQPSIGRLGLPAGRLCMFYSKVPFSEQNHECELLRYPNLKQIYVHSLKVRWPVWPWLLAFGSLGLLDYWLCAFVTQLVAHCLIPGWCVSLCFLLPRSSSRITFCKRWMSSPCEHNWPIVTLILEVKIDIVCIWQNIFPSIFFGLTGALCAILRFIVFEFLWALGVLQLRTTVWEDITRECTFSFGHCPN